MDKVIGRSSENKYEVLPLRYAILLNNAWARALMSVRDLIGDMNPGVVN